MGFLMKPMRRLVVGSGTVIALVMAGCSGLRLGDVLGISMAPYLLHKLPQQASVESADDIAPPLTPVWEEDVTAGVGSDSPVILDSVLLVGNLRGELHALHLKDGKKLGWVGLGNAVAGSPVLRGTVAYVGLSGTKESLVAYDILFGRALWKRALGPVQSTPLLIQKLLFVGNADGTLFCLDSDSGEVVWKFELPDNSTRKGIRARAAGDSTTVFFGADDGAVYALDASNGKLSWRLPLGAAIQAPVVHDAGQVFAATLEGRIAAIDPQRGTLSWSASLAAPIYAPARVTSRALVVCATNGVVAAFDRTSGTPLWRYVAAGPINAAPLLAGNHLFVGTLKKELFALDITTGTVVWTTTVAGRIKTAPTGAKGMVIVATDEPMIVAYRGTTR
jgi:outer membrane protein assembly factor BamB